MAFDTDIVDGQKVWRPVETAAAEGKDGAKRAEQDQIAELQRLLEFRIAELTRIAGSPMPPEIASQIQSMRAAIAGGNLTTLALVYNQVGAIKTDIAEAQAESTSVLARHYEQAYNAPLSREARERIEAVGRNYNLDNVTEREDLARLFVNPNAPDAAQAVQGAARDPETIALQREYVSHPAEARRGAEEHIERSKNGLKAAINATKEGSQERAVLERAQSDGHFRNPEVRKKLKEYINNKDEKALDDAKELMDKRDKHVQAKAQEKGTSVTQERIGLSLEDSLKTIAELGKGKDLEKLQTYNQIISGKSEVFGRSEKLSEQEQLNEVAKLVKRQGMTDAQAQELAKAVLSSSEIKAMKAVDLNQKIDDAMMAGFKAMQKGDSALSFQLAKDVEALMKESGYSDKEAASMGAFLTEGAKLGVKSQTLMSTFSEETAKLSIAITLKEMKDAVAQGREPSMVNVQYAFTKSKAIEGISSATSAVTNALGFGGDTTKAKETPVIAAQPAQPAQPTVNAKELEQAKKKFDVNGDGKLSVEEIKKTMAASGVSYEKFAGRDGIISNAELIAAANSMATQNVAAGQSIAPSSTPNRPAAGLQAVKY